VLDLGNGPEVKVHGTSQLGACLNICPHHSYLMILLREVMQHNVAERHQAAQLLAVTDGQVTKAVLAHNLHAGFHCVARANRFWIWRHHRADFGRARVKLFGDYALHEVSFGKDANQDPIVQHWHGSYIPSHHGLNQFEYSLVDIGAVDFLAFYQLANQHLPPPGLLRCTNLRREYMLNFCGMEE